MFTLKVKDGDYGYRKDGTYGSYDYIFETEDAVEAMRQFLEYVQGEDFEDGATVKMTFKTTKGKKEK